MANIVDIVNIDTEILNHVIKVSKSFI